MKKTSFLLAICVFLTIFSKVSLAQTTLSVDVNASSPGFTVASSPLGGVTGCGIQSGDHKYASVTFEALTSTGHAISTTSIVAVDGNDFDNDNFFALYQGAFRPQSPTSGLVACDDDSGPATFAQISSASLTAGQVYTLVVTSFTRVTSTTPARFIYGRVNLSINPAISLVYTVGGTVSGLGAGKSVTIENNSGDSTVVSTNGSFAFGTPLTNSSAYNVTISGQPVGQTCVVSGGTGNIASANVNSVSISCSSGPSVPGAPTGVTAQAIDADRGFPNSASARVSFTPPASNGGAAITSYTVTSSPGGITATGSASPITVTGLTAGTSYTFTVTATNSQGVGPASSASSAVTPAIAVPSLTGWALIIFAALMMGAMLWYQRTAVRNDR